MTDKTTVRVGVGCFVVSSKGEFITGVRKGSHGSGCIQLPGGHLELGETFETCVQREILEETGIKLDANDGRIEFLTTTNDVFEEGKHYVTIFMRCRVDETKCEPKVMEPDKCESWQWTTWEGLKRIANDETERSKLFLPLRNLISQRPEVDPTRE
ncbi:nucleotide triphosphate diphosphatase NUDT15 [Sporobolomyces salmoneus]|uniref:nucleotide triphosphate diphosphatase NUDT15 n=1 Tax=Sporobolomyces salmoneus TaxID=183962 RepID=UPI00317FC9BB